MLLRVLDLFGVTVFAISGALVAGRKNMDFLGVIVLAVVTAIGGGTIRDVLLDRHPIFWTRDTTYLLVIISASVATLFYARFWEVPDKALLIADAFGLAFFTVSGAQIAEGQQLPDIIVAVMAAITGAAGGVVRDVLSAEVPLIFRADIYATSSLAGATVYMIVKRVWMDVTVATVVAMAAVMLLRIATILWGLHLPRFVLRTDEEQ